MNFSGCGYGRGYGDSDSRGYGCDFSYNDDLGFIDNAGTGY